MPNSQPQEAQPEARQVEALILDKVRARYSEVGSSQDINAQTPLENLKLDSLSVLELIYELEEHYRIVVDDERLLQLKCINDIVDLVMQARRPGQQG